MITNSILQGRLPMPTINKLNQLDPQAYTQIELMWQAMWTTYLHNKGTINVPYWAKRVANPKVHNIALKVLAQAGWITILTQPHRNWSEAKLNEAKLLQYVTKSQLDSVRKYYKFNKYLLTNTKSEVSDKVRVNGKIKRTGLNRPGFTKAGNTQFQFDIQYLSVYKEPITKLVNKGIQKMAIRYPQLLDDGANYQEVGAEIVNYYASHNGTYTSGERASDSRGRDIAGYLNKIGNPVGFKIMRALLTIPFHKRKFATKEGLTNKYLFIAELNGFKNGTTDDKAEFGKQCYKNRTLPHYNLTTELDELPDAIWCMRTYDDIDAYHSTSNHRWTTPIEIDMSASVIGFYALLLGDRRGMARTNMIGNILGDAWHNDTITNRTQCKTIMRRLYGSNMQPDEMWSKMSIPYTQAEVEAFNHETTKGEFAVYNAFKDFIIDNVKPKHTMQVNINNEVFVIECNKFRNAGESTIVFDLYDSATNSVKRIHHTDTIKIPNLKAFRRFFATLLIHNLDSQCMDKSIVNLDWVLPIHDAMIVCAEEATQGRVNYAKELEAIYSNRNKIISNYFTSIGISNKTLPQFKQQVQSLVQPLAGEFKCNLMVLK